MKKFFTFMIFIFTALPFSAQAADPVALYPMGAWSFQNVGQQCVVQNYYNNGFGIGLTENGETAVMSINFEQDIFTVGDAYTAGLQVGSENLDVSTLAKSPSVLDITIKSPGFYEALSQTGRFDIDIEGNAFRFFTNGFVGADADLSACIKPTATDKAVIVEVHDSAAPVQTIVPQTLPPVQSSMAPMPDTSDLEARLAAIRAENSELKIQLEEAELEMVKTPPMVDGPLSSADWNLEKATMRYQEAERQMKELGQKLALERTQCDMQKQELEAMLFDPRVTEERQLAELANLQDQVTDLQEELVAQRLRYEERIKLLEAQR